MVSKDRAVTACPDTPLIDTVESLVKTSQCYQFIILCSKSTRKSVLIEPYWKWLSVVTNVISSIPMEGEKEKMLKGLGILALWRCCRARSTSAPIVLRWRNGRQDEYIAPGSEQTRV